MEKLINIVNEYLDNQNRHEDRIEHMNALDEFMDGMTAAQIIQEVEEGFNVHHEYMQLNGAGRWQSLDEADARKEVIFLVSHDHRFIDFLIDRGYIEFIECDNFEDVADAYNYNSNYYDLLEDYTLDFALLDSLLNKYIFYKHEDMYYIEQYQI